MGDSEKPGLAAARRRPLELEVLEERIAPAGVVTAAVSAGNLVITGDDFANDIVIDHAGLVAGEIRIASGVDATTINGGAEAILPGFTGGIVLRMHDGDDHAVLNDIEAVRSINFDGGTGANHFELTGGAVGGSLTIVNGMVVELDSASVTGNVTVRNGPGQSITDIGALTAHNLVIRSAATAQTRLANIADSTLSGALRISNAGPGPTGTYVSSTSMTMLSVANGPGDDVTVAQGITCSSTGTAVSVSNGVQDASTEISGASNIAGHVRIRSFAWSDTIQILDSTIIKSLTVTNNFSSLFLGGLGVYVDNSTIGVDDVNGVYSGVRVSAPFCQALLSLTGSEIGKNLAASFAGGDVYAESVTIGGNLAVKSIGFSAADVDINATTVDGSTSIATYYHDNTVRIDDSVFTGAVVISTGKGNDVVEIEANGLADGPVSTFGGPVTVKTSDGDDTVILGLVGQNGNHGDYSRAVSLDGGRGTDTVTAMPGANTFAIVPVPVGFEVIVM